MNNFDRNTRTLIVSFLVAIFALIPLRFIEFGQEQQLIMNQSQVLGETVNSQKEEVIDDCVNLEDIEFAEEELYFNFIEGMIDESEMEVSLREIGDKRNNICQ